MTVIASQERAAILRYYSTITSLDLATAGVHQGQLRLVIASLRTFGYVSCLGLAPRTRAIFPSARVASPSHLSSLFLNMYATQHIYSILGIFVISSRELIPAGHLERSHSS